MGISLSGTEAWRVDDRLPPNSYLFRVGAVDRSESSGKNPQVVVDWRVASGDWKGAEQRDYITVTEAAMGRVVQLLDACEIPVPENDFKDYGEVADWLAEKLKAFDGVVEGVVRLDQWVVAPDRRKGPDDDGSREGPKLKGYRKPDPGDLNNDSSGFASGPSVKSDDKKAPF